MTATDTAPAPIRTRHHHAAGRTWAHGLLPGTGTLAGCPDCTAEDAAGATANVTAGCRRAFHAERLGDGMPPDRASFITDDQALLPGDVVRLAGARWRLTRRTR
jgi:hypothetical protein